MTKCKHCSLLFFTVYLPLILAIVFSEGCTFRLNTASGGGVSPCEQAVRRAAALEKATVVIDSPDNIHGKWVSEGCETRPGPEFLLRSYSFHANSSFRLVQHYYADESCTSPVYTAIARGKLRQGGQYSLSRVSLVPHTAEVAQQLASKIFSTCAGISRKRWMPFREYFILKLGDEPSTGILRPYITTSSSGQDIPPKTYNKKGFKLVHPESFNCLNSISLVFHELQHYKVQIRLGTDDHFVVTHYRQELLLGDIHSRLESRVSYRPTAYQVPLLKVDTSITDTLGLESDSLIQSDSLLNIDAKGVEETRGRVREKSFVGHFDAGKVGDIDSIASSKDVKEQISEKVLKKNLDIFHHCPVCSTIAAANEKSPPYLMTKPMLPLYLAGEWVSLNCENRPMGLYLTRHFKFYSGDNTWIVEYKFYSDTICSGTSFSVTAAGHFKKGKANHHMPGASEVDFHLERASLTVLDPHMMEHLERDPSCGLGDWKIGVPREMSSTRGCATLGLVVPSVEYELIKMEIDFQGSPMLYMGQADTDNRRRGPKERPTAYQPALVQCQELPLYSESLRDILNSPLYSDKEYSHYDIRVLAMDIGSGGSTMFTNKLLLLVIVTFYHLL